VAFLSGGNQQKVVVAKWLRTNPRILILDEPTLGVDVGARQEIYTLIMRLASEGTAVILISSDFEELGICQRIIALREGRLVGEVDGRAPKYRLTELCYSTEEAS
jgi:ribose transport system ATP-binding protein